MSSTETSTTPGSCNPGTWTAQINDLNQSLESSGMQRALMMEAVRTSETSVYSKETTLMMEAVRTSETSVYSKETTLMIEAVRTSETSFYSKETTLLYIPDVSKLHTRRRENLKSYNELNQQPQKTRELCEQLKEVVSGSRPTLNASESQNLEDFTTVLQEIFAASSDVMIE
jgi:hypothetical protein